MASLYFWMLLKKMYYYLPMKKVALLVFVFETLALSGHAQVYKLRTVVVYSFTRYIVWPDGSNTGDFEIKVLGDSPFLSELNVMAQSKKVGDRPIKITKINDLSELKKCNILILPSGKSSQLNAVL
jgi:hypothetical protein